MTKALKVVSNFEPAGSQPDAIKSLVGGLNDGLLHQTLHCRNHATRFAGHRD